MVWLLECWVWANVPYKYSSPALGDEVPPEQIHLTVSCDIIQVPSDEHPGKESGNC